MPRWLKVRTTTRLALAIAAIAGFCVWSAQRLGVISGFEDAQIENRVQLCESVALHASQYIEQGRAGRFNEVGDILLERTDGFESMALIAEKGARPYTSADHQTCVADDNLQKVTVAISRHQKPWGHIVMTFQPGTEQASNFLLMTLFIASGAGFLSWILLSRTLKYLNPSNAVPQRVRSAFDTLTEGLVLLDENGTIVHGNQRFSEMVERPMEEMLGTNVDSVDWELNDADETFAWDEATAKKAEVTGQLIKLVRDGEELIFTTNAAPLMGKNETFRGILVSFDDVTALEAKKADLASMVETLRESRDQISEQNERLQFLASRDPLTKCYNRRYFWEVCDQVWETVDPELLSLIMIDLDHFKSINDTHGHGVGDDVLKELGELLRNLFPTDDFLVSRFGGEEFAVMIQNHDFDKATEFAEQIKKGLHDNKLGGLDVTASIGVSNRAMGAMDGQHLIDQADESLYFAKRTGRDRVIRYDQFTKEELEALTDDHPRDSGSTSQGPYRDISYASAYGLLSTIALQNRTLAEHSLRVADLSVSLGRSFLAPQSLYELEIGAMLHEVGILGRPKDLDGDNVDWLTRQEFRRTKDQLGGEILEQILGNSRIGQIVVCHRYFYADYNSEVRQDIRQNVIPLEARIVAICNAFDDLAFVKKQGWRKALIELKERQVEFDPKLLDAFILTVHDSSDRIETMGEGNLKQIPSAKQVGERVETLYQAIETSDLDTIRQTLQEFTDVPESYREIVESKETSLDDAMNVLFELISISRQPTKLAKQLTSTIVN